MNKSIKKNLLFFISIAFISCSKEYSEKIVFNKQLIVVLGSSSASGMGLNKGESWVDRLEVHFKDTFNIINLSKPGQSSYHIMPNNFYTLQRPSPDTLRNISKALCYKPNRIIINIPTNDISSGYSVSEYLFNLDSLFRTAKNDNIEIYITTTQPRSLHLQDRTKLIYLKDKILTRYGRYSINFWDSIATDDGYIIKDYDQGDGVHLNAKAHNILFDRVKLKL